MSKTKKGQKRGKSGSADESEFVKKLKVYQKKHGIFQAQLAEKLGHQRC